MPKRNASVSKELEALKNALSGAERCLDIARRERERIDETLNSSHAIGMAAERQVLEHAREGRQQLEALEQAVPLATTVAPALEPAEPLDVQEDLLNVAFATL